MSPANHRAEMPPVLIREFQPGDEVAFRQLNEEWITRYFRMEPKDEEALTNPQSGILAAGGRIFFATMEGRPVGCCALVPDGESELELAKMAVTASCQGSGIGRRLLETAIGAARAMGAGRLSLETNRVLATAIRLYESVGFRHVPRRPSPYERSDVRMEMEL